MAKTTREPVSHLQWLSRWREEVRETAPQNRARGREISTDQMLDEGRSAEVGVQAVYDEETLALCRLAAFKPKLKGLCVLWWQYGDRRQGCGL